MTQEQMEEIILRLVCQSAALTFVLASVPAGDGEPILNAQRSMLYQKRLDEELAAKGLQ